MGAKIPGENDLARDYGVSRTTVRQAVESLGNLVERRPGQGTFVIKIEPLVTTLSGDSKPDKGLSGGGEGQAIFDEARTRSRRTGSPAASRWSRSLLTASSPAS